MCSFTLEKSVRVNNAYATINLVLISFPPTTDHGILVDRSVGSGSRFIVSYCLILHAVSVFWLSLWV